MKETVEILCPCCGEILTVSVEVKHKSSRSPVQAIKEANGKIGDVQKDGATDMSFCDPVNEINFSGCRFCFTGKFTYAMRKELQESVSKLGGENSDTVTRDLHYLVVGAAASAGWAFGKYGTKIESAFHMKKTSPVAPLIVSETDFLKALQIAIDKREDLKQAEE